MRKVFCGQMTEKVKISSEEFYRLGGFNNPQLFRTSEGHFKQQDTAAYKKFKENRHGQSIKSD